MQRDTEFNRNVACAYTLNASQKEFQWQIFWIRNAQMTVYTILWL